MGFVGLHFHNTSTSMAVQHMSLKKFQNFFFQKCNKSVYVPSYNDTLSIFSMRVREDHFVFIFTIANFMLIWNHSKSCTPSCNWGQLMNFYCKTKVGAYNDKVPWGCRRFWSSKGLAPRIPCQSDLGLQEILPIKLCKPEPGMILCITQSVIVTTSQSDSRWV